MRGTSKLHPVGFAGSGQWSACRIVQSAHLSCRGGHAGSIVAVRLSG